MTDKPKIYKSAKAVCDRYGGISDRTSYRWVEAGLLPPPTYIGTRRFWDEAELDALDEARKQGAAS